VGMGAGGVQSGRFRSRAVLRYRGQLGDVNRPYTHSQALFYTTLAKFSVLYLLAAALFVALYSWGTQVTTDSKAMTQGVHLSGVLVALARQATFATRAYAAGHFVATPQLMYNTSEPPPNALSTDATVLAALKAAAAGYAAATDTAHSGLAFGDPQFGTKGVGSDSSSAEQRTLFFENACVREPPVNCSTGLGGVMATGLHVAVRDYVGFVTSALAFSGGRDGEALGSSALADAVELETKYLHQVMWESHLLYREDTDAVVSDFLNAAWLIVAAFAVFNLLNYLLVYRVLLEQLDLDLRNTRSMLLLIPAEVSRSVPKIANFVRSASEMA